jgi:hypothetical protein
VVSERTQESLESQLTSFMCSPDEYFENSYTKTHSMRRDLLLDLHQKGLARRFAQQSDRIAMVDRLARKQGIGTIDRFEDVVPILFEHTMYKSYPVSLLERQDFARLTSWLGRLTSCDVTQVDVAGCDSIGAWLDRLFERTDLDVSFSGGTSGTLSFLPWNRSDRMLKSRVNRINLLQAFGEEPSAASNNEPYHFLSAGTRSRIYYDADAITLGQAEYLHQRGSRMNVDLLWLAARLRLANARGDASRVEVPENLLKRRPELEDRRAQEQAEEQAWSAAIAAMHGERIFWNTTAIEAYSIVTSQAEHGAPLAFAPGSVVIVTGNTAKWPDLPANWQDAVEKTPGLRLVRAYNMQELHMYSLLCSAGRYHLHPSIVPYVLDPASSAVMPRSGVQVGRLAFFDLLTESHWGGFITGDEVTLDFDGACACGATSYHLAPGIVRFSEKYGGEDNITCAATPAAFEEAMNFLVGY